MDRLFEGAKAIDMHIGEQLGSTPAAAAAGTTAAAASLGEREGGGWQGAEQDGRRGERWDASRAFETTGILLQKTIRPDWLSPVHAKRPPAGLTKQQLTDLVYQTADANGMHDHVHSEYSVCTGSGSGDVGVGVAIRFRQEGVCGVCSPPPPPPLPPHRTPPLLQSA